ncbi:hypothetical protein [Chamaesiphon sp. VAR_48_metabat_403]|nr:hypothetical protein [Chamaesiphon sp. VAR_48_metabat_403]
MLLITIQTHLNPDRIQIYVVTHTFDRQSTYRDEDKITKCDRPHRYQN